MLPCEHYGCRLAQTLRELKTMGLIGIGLIVTALLYSPAAF